MKKLVTKDKFDAPVNSDYAVEFQKDKATKALEKAKKLETQQRANGKKYVRLDAKTRVLRKQ